MNERLTRIIRFCQHPVSRGRDVRRHLRWWLADELVKLALHAGFCLTAVYLAGGS